VVYGRWILPPSSHIGGLGGILFVFPFPFNTSCTRSSPHMLIPAALLSDTSMSAHERLYLFSSLVLCMIPHYCTLNFSVASVPRFDFARRAAAMDQLDVFQLESLNL
jgi:hypothetical protein